MRLLKTLFDLVGVFFPVHQRLERLKNGPLGPCRSEDIVASSSLSSKKRQNID